jgi:uncharacterized protein YutE (UPF0331/DUF86 family)
VLDRERILAKVDELDGYLRELRAIVPPTFESYQHIEKRRACERLLQIAVEAVIDICHLFVAGLRLGLPAEEDDLFEKLAQAGIISAPIRETLRRMTGCRDILVHQYERVDDAIIYEYETVSTRLDDFDAFRREILDALPRAAEPKPA